MRKIFSLLIITCTCIACQSELPNSSVENNVKLEKEAVKSVLNYLKSTPCILNLVDEKKNKLYKIDLKSRKLIEEKSWSFSNMDLNTIYAENGYITMYASIDNLQENSSSYTLQIGNETLTVKTMCLALDYSSFISALGSLGSNFPFDGFSAVIGIDADFSLLSNASSNNIGDFFHGMASYYVYDFEASGDYEVWDWWNLESLESNNSVAYAFLFSNDNFGSFHFSKDGTINVNGGNMNFEGNYYKIDYDFFLINDSLEFETVPGSGTMGCQ